ncbi:MAG: hypothetical protein IIC82_03875 [Chloroflexi bacterium]|nr:hypothetical protein [Chloroflexota bacterium]
MKILLTGTTTLMSNQQRQKTSTFLSFFPLLYQMLTDLGHDVDWRAVHPRNTLSHYDIALLGLQAVNGLAGKQYRYGTLWAASRLPHAVVFDDWQVRTSCRSLMRPKNFWKMAMLGKRELEERAFALKHCKKELELVRTSWFEQLPMVIAPLFEWGHHSQFKEVHPMENLCAIDPTCYVPKIKVNQTTISGSPKRKFRRWFYAGLKDHSHTLPRMGFDGEGNSWPISTQMPQAGVRGWGRVAEQIVVQMYYDSWGVISVPYSKLMLGTGWWRSTAGCTLLEERCPVSLLTRPYPRPDTRRRTAPRGGRGWRGTA